MDSISSKYSQSHVEVAVRDFRADVKRGLSSVEAAQRRVQYGDNELVGDNEESIISKFMEQFKNPLILLLFASAAISMLIGHTEDSISIALAIVIVVTVAFVQEYQSEKSIQALSKLVPHHCHVLRDSHYLTLIATELVPGDIIKFSTGDRIPADVRLLETVDLEIDESSLTGENSPSKKNTNVIASNGSELALAERYNIAFMGTLVRNGYGTGLVIATGMNTEFGRVFDMMRDVETRRSPLQDKMDELGKHLSIMSILIIFLIFLVGLYQGRPLLDMFTIGVSLAVAAIPEGLPIVVTVTLALGVLRMSNRSAIVKKLPSVEALGSVSVICADKTGTLTQNKMKVSVCYLAAEDKILDLETYVSPSSATSEAALKLFRCGSLCNNAQISDDAHIGQPTEVAILEALKSLNFSDLRSKMRRLSETPFNSERKYMSVQYEDGFYFKGAADAIIPLCKYVYSNEKLLIPFTESMKDNLDLKSKMYSTRGLRVIYFVWGPDVHNLSLLGFMAMSDPPRLNVLETIKTLYAGGVRVVMITGDAKETAISIATKIGLLSDGFDSNASTPTTGVFTMEKTVMSGTELDNISQEGLKQLIRTISVFYRTTPKHKMTIVKALQDSGVVVAMTGDGVNDAPALKLADIGVSMGLSGTDVSKEAADMILVNDEFSTLLYAIEEGKCIFYNIQNFLRFQLSTSIAALIMIAIATALGLPNPLNASQILWINIICDGPVAQSLGVEQVDPNVMRQPPRSKNQPIITRGFILRVLFSAVPIVAGTLLVYHYGMSDGATTKRDSTLTFTCFVFFDLFNSITCRSKERSIFQLGFFSNKMFNYALLFVLCGQLLVVYLPILQQVFQTVSLSAQDLFIIFVISSSVLWLDEARKLVVRNGGFQGTLLKLNIILSPYFSYDSNERNSFL